MKTFIQNFRNAIRYSISDWKIIIIIGSLMFLISFLNKISVTDPIISKIIFVISNLLLFLEVGFGSKIVATSIQGEAKPPKLNKIHKLIWEGLKKTIIIGIYIYILKHIIIQAQFYASKISPICVIFYLLFLIVYILLILGLINRYNYNGSFIKAFDFKEIFKLFRKIKIKNLVFVMICAGLSQITAIQCFIDLNMGFSIIEAAHTIITFFLAPWILLTTKRFIALNVGDLLKSMKKKLKNNS